MSPSRSVSVDSESELSEGALMRKMMGIGGFDSTKGKHVAGTDVSGTDVRPKKRRYRQVLIYVIELRL